MRAQHTTRRRTGIRGVSMSACVIACSIACACAGQQPSLQNGEAQTQKRYAPAATEVQGTPLDRVVAIVNGAIILDSDVNEELRFDALNLDEQNLGPSTETPEAPDRSATLERLINRELILQQIRLEPHSDVSDEDLNDEISELRTSLPACVRYDCKSDAGWKAYLASIHVTEPVFRAHWRERMQVLAFTERRFRMGIRITPEQERAYYDHTLLPKYAAAKVTAPPFASIADRIEQVLIEQQVSALLSDWLHSLRAQGSVIVLHPGEVAP